MFPGMNKRQMAQAMKKMGIKQQELDAVEVIIKLKDRKLIIQNPQVAKVNMMGQSTYQITGEAVEQEQSSDPEISQDDVNVVVQQTNVSEEKAKKGIQEAKGDLAQAIMQLQS